MYERIVIVILLVLLVVAILLPRGAENAAAPPDVLTVIHQRKSVRNYTAEPVAAKELDQLVRAGFAAPSAVDSSNAGSKETSPPSTRSARSVRSLTSWLYA